MPARKKPEDQRRSKRLPIGFTEQERHQIEELIGTEFESASQVVRYFFNKGLAPITATPSERIVRLPLLADVPCGDCADIVQCIQDVGETEPIEVRGRLADLATPHSWVAKASGFSMSNAERPDGIGDDDMLLMIPFDEYSGTLKPGVVVLAKLKYKNGTEKCTLKEYQGKKGLRARNPEFPGVNFGPDIEEATVWAIAGGVLEKVLLNG